MRAGDALAALDDARLSAFLGQSLLTSREASRESLEALLALTQAFRTLGRATARTPLHGAGDRLDRRRASGALLRPTRPGGGAASGLVTRS